MTTDTALQEQLALSNAMLTLVQERLAELENSLEAQDWQRIGIDGEREFSREGLRRIAALSRLMFLKNPLVNRAVLIQSYYIWAQGVSIEAADPETDKLVQAWLDDPKNKAELTSHQARTLKEQDLQVEGNLFFALFPDPLAKTVRVRTIPPAEIDDIITNPDDAKEVWYYRRRWTQRTFNVGRGQVGAKSQEAYYPDWEFKPEGGHPARIGEAPVEARTPVYHVKVGGLSDMRFGVPETYQALDWAKAYKQFLENWATIAASLARFAWQGKTTGGQAGVTALVTRLNTTLGTGGTGNSETNPPPTAGAAFVGTPGVDLAPLRTAGATTGPEEGRRLLLMVAAASGLPETFFGDASVGTVATAKSLDRPTELKFMDRRTLWRDVLGGMIQYMLDVAKVPRTEARRQVAIDFPSLTEHDIAESVGAIVSAATLDGKPDAGTIDPRTVSRLLLTALGVNDVDELLDKIAPDDGAPLSIKPETEAALQEALRVLRDERTAPAR